MQDRPQCGLGGDLVEGIHLRGGEAHLRHVVVLAGEVDGLVADQLAGLLGRHFGPGHPGALVEVLKEAAQRGHDAVGAAVAAQHFFAVHDALFEGLAVINDYEFGHGDSVIEKLEMLQGFDDAVAALGMCAKDALGGRQLFEQAGLGAAHGD